MYLLNKSILNIYDVEFTKVTIDSIEFSIHLVHEIASTRIEYLKILILDLHLKNQNIHINYFMKMRLKLCRKKVWIKTELGSNPTENAY